MSRTLRGVHDSSLLSSMASKIALPESAYRKLFFEGLVCKSLNEVGALRVAVGTSRRWRCRSCAASSSSSSAVIGSSKLLEPRRARPTGASCLTDYPARAAAIPLD